MKTTRHETQALQAAIAMITDAITTDAIYCFGTKKNSAQTVSRLFPAHAIQDKTIHLYLLAFVGAGAGGMAEKIMGLVREKSLGTVTVTLLLYETAKLNRIKGNHRCFIDDVCTKGELVYGREGYRAHRFQSYPAPDIKAKEDYWRHCKYMAVCCLEAETAIENPNAEAVQAVLLHQAVEQVALGIIYFYLGCRPGYHGLGYLLDLCALCFPDVGDIFPRYTTEEQRRFSVLSKRMDDLRYRGVPPSITDIEILRARAHRFLNAATEAAEGLVRVA